MLKLSPKVELLVAGWALVICASMLAISLVFTVPLYRSAKQKSGQAVTLSAEGYDNLLRAYRALFFRLLPVAAVVSAGAGWLMLKHAKRIENRAPPES